MLLHLHAAGPPKPRYFHCERSRCWRERNPVGRKSFLIDDVLNGTNSTKEAKPGSTFTKEASQRKGNNAVRLAWQIFK